MRRVQLGLIGCGQIGLAVHLANLRRIKGVNITAVADSDSSRRGLAQAALPHASVYHDYHQLLNEAEVEAVIIALPSALHADAAIAAFEHDKHVYLEKPLATTLAEGEQVVEAWRRSGKQAMIGFNYRFNPLHLEVRCQLGVGRLGRLLAARSAFTTGSCLLPAWKRARATGGGVLLDLASHHVDLLRFWFNQPVIEVRATVQSIQYQDDAAALELHLPNEFVVQSFFSVGTVEDDHFEIYGQAGKLAFNRYTSWNVEFANGPSSPPVSRHLRRLMSAIARSRFVINKLWAPACEQSFRLALAHFVDAVRTDAPVKPDFQDGLEALRVIVAAEESALTGQWVPISQPEGLPQPNGSRAR